MLPTNYAGIEGLVEAEAVTPLTLKGFQRPVATYTVRALKC